MSEFMLLGNHEPDTLVAFGGAGNKSAADLLADAAKVSRALPPAFDGSHVLLVFENDRYAMAAAMIGALDRGHAVALPPNTRRDSVLAIHERPDTAIVLHDTDAGFPIGISEILGNGDAVDAGQVSLASPIVPGAGTIATVFTSGTTGPATPWQKTNEQLLGEAHALGVAFDIRKDDRIVGAVAPGHIYGLLFTMLLPLMRGAAFSRETPFHAEAVAQYVDKGDATVLVTVPVQLRALASVQAGSFSSLRRVFSSTGPLPEPVALEFRERHALDVTEILGSTETGGIASRSRGGNGLDRWQPFKEVSVSVSGDGQLEVDSPFIDPNVDRPFETADLVELHEDGTFTHLGRADGIVKIGGRRVSIADVEDSIRQQEQIDDVAVVAVPAEGGRGHQLLAVVVPPSFDADALRRALLEKWEPTCLPRRILGAEVLPKEANGKIERTELLRMFGLGPEGCPPNWNLVWGEPKVDRTPERESYEVSVRVPEDYAWFEGHFDRFPVLAGATQLKELILPTVERGFPELGDVETMSRIKFSGRITPGDSLTVRVARGAKRQRVEFEIRKSTELCAKGVLDLSLMRVQ